MCSLGILLDVALLLLEAKVLSMSKSAFYILKLVGPFLGTEEDLAAVTHLLLCAQHEAASEKPKRPLVQNAAHRFFTF